MRSVKITYRPLTLWPGELTRDRKRSPFDSPWSATMDLLDRELWMLEASDVVLQIALAEQIARGAL